MKARSSKLGNWLGVINGELKESWWNFILITFGYFLSYNFIVMLSGAFFRELQPSGVKLTSPNFERLQYEIARVVIIFLGVGRSGRPIPMSYVTLESLINMVLSSIFLSILLLLILRRRKIKHCPLSTTTKGSAGTIGAWLSSIIALGATGCPVCGWAPSIVLAALGFSTSAGGAAIITSKYGVLIMSLSLLLQIGLVLYYASIISAIYAGGVTENRSTRLESPR